MFQRILVPLDGSLRAEQALPVAARIARATGGSLLLVQVINPVLATKGVPADVHDAWERDSRTCAILFGNPCSGADGSKGGSDGSDSSSTMLRKTTRLTLPLTLLAM